MLASETKFFLLIGSLSRIWSFHWLNFDTFWHIGQYHSSNAKLYHLSQESEERNLLIVKLSSVSDPQQIMRPASHKYATRCQAEFSLMFPIPIWTDLHSLRTKSLLTGKKQPGLWSNSLLFVYIMFLPTARSMCPILLECWPAWQDSRTGGKERWSWWRACRRQSTQYCQSCSRCFRQSRLSQHCLDEWKHRHRQTRSIASDGLQKLISWTIYVLTMTDSGW